MSFLIFLCGFVFFIILLAFLGTFFTVDQQTISVVERFGRFKNLANPGLNFKVPFIDRVAGKLSLRVQQLDVKAETKTQDNVFLHITVSVQYYIIPDKVYDAFYKLEDPSRQINSYVFDTIRARVPKITIDRLFEEKEEIAKAVKDELNETMNDFGFEILNSLVTDIDPDAKVKVAMNEINAAERMKVAARERGEADKIMKVKAAEADAEAKALQGKGIADQRLAIVQGLRESVEDFQGNVPGTTAHDVMNLVLMTQYFDTLKDVGEKSNNSILIPHSPGGMQDIQNQMRNAILEANMLKPAEDTKHHKE